MHRVLRPAAMRGDVRAVDAILKLMQRRALLGLDGPARHDVMPGGEPIACGEVIRPSPGPEAAEGPRLATRPARQDALSGVRARSGPVDIGPLAASIGPPAKLLASRTDGGRPSIRKVTDGGTAGSE